MDAQMKAQLEASRNELKKQLVDIAKQELDLKGEIKARFAELSTNENNYYRLQLENDELRREAEEQLRINSDQSDRFMAHLNEVQKYYGRASKEVNDALEEFASEKLAERKMVLQTFQLFKDIPNDYSDEVISEKTKAADQDIEKIKLEIQEEKEILADLKRHFQLKIADRCKCDPELETFITELKMINVKLNFAHKN